MDLITGFLFEDFAEMEAPLIERRNVSLCPFWNLNNVGAVVDKRWSLECACNLRLHRAIESLWGEWGACEYLKFNFSSVTFLCLYSKEPFCCLLCFLAVGKAWKVFGSELRQEHNWGQWKTWSKYKGTLWISDFHSVIFVQYICECV